MNRLKLLLHNSSANPASGWFGRWRFSRTVNQSPAPPCRSELDREQSAEGVLQGPVTRQARGVAPGRVLGQGGAHVLQIPGGAEEKCVRQATNSK